jgi:GAF domain-containing protein
MEMIRAIALQTALAADNARLVEQTQLALQETEGLFEATRTIAGLTQITGICQSLANYANTLEQADRTIVILADTQRRQVFARAGAGNVAGELDLTFDELEAGIAGKVLRSGEPVLSGSADDGLKPEPRKRRPIGSLIVAPLAIKGQVVGVISVANRPGQRQLTQHDVELILALAGPAATAIENVRLLEATQRRAERERLIRQITTRVRAATDIESVLETTASELAHTLSVPRAIVRLTTGDGASKA